MEVQIRQLSCLMEYPTLLLYESEMRELLEMVSHLLPEPGAEPGTGKMRLHKGNSRGGDRRSVEAAKRKREQIRGDFYLPTESRPDMKRKLQCKNWTAGFDFRLAELFIVGVAHRYPTESGTHMSHLCENYTCVEHVQWEQQWANTKYRKEDGPECTCPLPVKCVFGEHPGWQRKKPGKKGKQVELQT